MFKAMRLDIPIVLPGVSADDACVGKLVALLAQRPGVASVHVLRPGEPPPFDAIHGTARDHRPAMPQRPSGALCLHYDPSQLTMADVADMSLRESSRLAKRYGHVTLPLEASAARFQPGVVESALGALPGVIHVTPDYTAHVVRVEYDVGATSAGSIREQAAIPYPHDSIGRRLARHIRAFLDRW